jgi:transcription termination/antitermination protein NusG
MVEEQIDIKDEVIDEVLDTDVAEDEQPLAEWYIMQCYTQQEYKVQAAIERLIDEKNFEKKILRVLIPEEETIEIKNNKRKERVSKIFPGYVFVKMLIDDEIYYELRRIPGVAKFIGSKTKPTPVTEAEILKVLRKVDDDTPKIDIDFEIDEIIKVINGPFRGYSGPISEINGEKGVLKALLSVFGRETPVSLSFDQVEKAVK